MKTLHIVLLLIFMSVLNFSCKNKKAISEAELKNDIDSLSYYTGIYTGQTLKALDDTSLNTTIFYNAVKEVLKVKDVKYTKTEIDKIIGKYFEKLYKQEDEKNLQLGRDFLLQNKSSFGVVENPSGLQYKIIRKGSGANARAKNRIIVNYICTSINKIEFDNTYKAGHPDTILIDKEAILPGLFEGLQLMNAGSKYKLYIPSELAFGNIPLPIEGLKPNMVVIYDIELISILQK
jgi:FKBP-type peptidyl-prolyl cis-trans isomerase FklB